MLSCLIFAFLKGPKHVAAAESFFFSPGTSRTERTERRVPGSNLFSQHTPEADRKLLSTCLTVVILKLCGPSPLVIRMALNDAEVRKQVGLYVVYPLFLQFELF